jgi:iron complex outermembrane receptor protein
MPPGCTRIRSNAATPENALQSEPLRYAGAVRFGLKLGAFAVTALVFAPERALAQRAGENVATQSSDAFGLSVGSDRSGLYSSDDVRGFNPVDAGNVRLDGLYFDQVDRLSFRLTDSNTIRVGPAALRYPFPAPTGLVDYALVRPRDSQVYSISLENGSGFSDGIGGAIEFKQPIDGERLGVSGGFGWRNMHRWEGGTGKVRNFGATLAWRPEREVSVTLFGGAFFYRSDEARPTYFPAGTAPPPRLKRKVDLSQPWTGRNSDSWAFGGVVKAPLGPVGLEAGLFYNSREQKRVFADLLFGVDPLGGVASRVVILDGNNRDASLSGELRLVRHWQADRLDHRLIASLRGRTRDRRFGGSQRYTPTGLPTASTILTRDVWADPGFDPQTLAKSLDEVRQLTYGLSYSLVSQGRFGLDASLSKTSYRKAIDFADPLLADPVTHDKPLMWNLAGTVNLNRALSLYGGISHGMEEALIAPEVAINRAEAPAAIHSRQVEAGLKYAITPRLTLIAGAFQITKPYYNLDPASRYRQLGTLRNRGLEFSLTGQLAPGLTVVGGTLLLDPRISGEAVDSHLIGSRPVGQVRRRSVLNIDWRFASGKSPVSIDAAIESLSSRTGNSANTLSAPARTVVNLGARYRFKAAGGTWLVRPVLLNVFDNYSWNVSSSGGFTYVSPRAMTLSVVTDF